MIGQTIGHYKILDTPGRRKVIIERLRTWKVFRNSSAVEGITRAIRTFSAPDKKISIYVFGDEVVNTVDRLNRRDSQGNRRKRRVPFGGSDSPT